MINSNNRKLALSGWLKENNPREYSTPIKLQKFLLFYELFSKIDGEISDLSHLRGYKIGPVFCDVWGDYTKERYYFDIKATEQYKALLLTVDVHGPTILRTNMPPRNFEEWYQAFDVKKTDKMYIPVNKRVVIW